MRLSLTRLFGFGLLIFPLQTFYFHQNPNPESSNLSDNPARLDVAFAPSDSVIFLEKQKTASPETTLSAKTLAVAQSFLGTPYATGTLDVNVTEQLVVNLRQLDCWTLVENSLAIAQTGDGDFETYQSHLQQLRYWGGTVSGFGSRIHYFSGWLLQAEKNGHLRDLTKDMGGIPYRKKISYITARPDKYPQIRKADNFRAVQSAEKRINAHAWHYIPKAKVAAMEHLIQEGDIIMLTSIKKDLDIAHQGFAVRRNGRIHLLNASSLSKRVVISKQTLTQYLASQKGQSGIMVARLKD
jgi:hypothetical protein